MTPTARSLAHLRKLGYHAEVVERFNWHTKRKHDLLGFIDIVALRSGEIVGVQTTSGSNVSARIAKIRSLPTFAIARAAGIAVVVHGWAKRGPRGKRKVWTLREERIEVEAAQETAG